MDFECQNAIVRPNSNAKIGFYMSKCDIRVKFELTSPCFKDMSICTTLTNFRTKCKVYAGGTNYM